TKRKTPRRILDIGTGSGVLAIAAARRLRVPVLASDIDRQAVIAARDNARLNRAASFIETIHATGLNARRFRDDAPFDLILANILLAPLKRLAAPATRLIAPGGHIVLSGLLRADAAAALSAYGAQGLALERRIDLEGWVTLVMRR
ncbi:MAG: 50S ribosomal protein L11 methyltransferase, partial [Pseudorhodoplanes sp.]